MSIATHKLIEDLAGVLQGDVRCDPLTVSLYATDASLYQIPPLGVVYPKHRDDVTAVLRYAQEHKLPVIPRGAGTGVAGESLGAGLVLDFSRYMRQIEWVGEGTVRVQPGVVLSQLNRVLRQFGRYFPPDPSGASVTTVGSMLALDAAGSHSVRVGSTRDHVQSLEIVRAGGECLEVGDESLSRAPAELSDVVLSEPPTNGHPHPDGHSKQTLIDRLGWLLHYNAPLIARHQPPLLRNRCGYMLRGILDHRTLHLARMLIGSEGTLAAFTAATLHTMPLPAHRGVVLLLFGKMDAAIRAVQAVAPLQPSATDLMDRRLLSLARESDERFLELIPADAEAALIIEQTGFSTAQMQDRLRQVVDCVKALPDISFAAHEAHRLADVEFFWSLPERVVPLLSRMQGPTRALPFVEDLAVPPEALHEFLVLARGVLQKHKVTNSFYAHAAAGQIHIRPFLELPTPEAAHRLEDLARDLYQAVYEVGGTISGEHGVGLSRSGFVRDQYGPLYDVFRQVKELFDPQSILNPGKILTDDPHLITKNLRLPAQKPAETVALQLQWNPGELLQAAARCNGCGHCRTQEPGLRMCPLFRLDPSEEASPRAKANLIRDLVSGRIPSDEWTGPEFKRIADLCVNCKQCQLECPSSVNVPQMMIEAKAAYVSAHGLSGADWLLSRAHSFGALGTALASPINWALNNPVTRWFLEKTVGIARQRKLPPFAKRTFLRTIRPELLQRPPTRGADRPVVYFVDHYVNFHDPELGQAFVEVLRYNGLKVFVPPNQVPSGMAMVSAGDLEGARDMAEANLRELAELARDGCSIVCTEPAAALCLKQEYPMLLNHPDARLVASRVVEAGAFLLDLHQQKKLRTNFQNLPLRVAYHTPCHLKALEQGAPLAQLLKLIPGLTVTEIEHGCSGMAGAYGLSRENFRNSVQIGWDLIHRMRGTEFIAGTTECSSCKLQMEQGTPTPTIHPLKLIALSYGLMPQLRKRLKPSRRELLVT